MPFGLNQQVYSDPRYANAQAQTDDISREVAVLMNDESEKLVNDITSSLLSLIKHKELNDLIDSAATVKANGDACIKELHNLKNGSRMAEIEMPKRVRELTIMEDRYIAVRNYLMPIIATVNKMYDFIHQEGLKIIDSGGDIRKTHAIALIHLGQCIHGLSAIFGKVTDKLGGIGVSLAKYKRCAILEIAVRNIDENDKGSVLRACFDRISRIQGRVPIMLPLSEEIAYDGVAISPEKLKALLDAEKCVKYIKNIKYMKNMDIVHDALKRIHNKEPLIGEIIKANGIMIDPASLEILIKGEEYAQGLKNTADVIDMRSKPRE